jgi:hypothetical protein
MEHDKVWTVYQFCFFNIFVAWLIHMIRPPRSKCQECPLYTRNRKARQEKLCNRRPNPSLRGGSNILLECAQEGVLLLGGLVCTVAELRGGVNPFQVDLLQGLSRCVHEHGLAEGHDSLLDTRDGALEDDEVVLDLTVSDKATHTTIELV